MFKRLVIAVILLGIVCGGIVWFKFFRDDMIAQFLGNMKPAPVPVTTLEVKPITWQPSIEAIGTANSAQGVDLAIKSGGQVKEILFAGNDSVTEGQPLLRIDDSSEIASLAAAKAALSLAQAEARRATTLTARGVGAATTAETADAQVERALAEVAQVETQLNNKQLTAPFSGIIGIPMVEAGAWVGAGVIFATLQDLSQMRVDFSVPEQQLALLELGGAISVLSEASDLKVSGKIIAIEPRVDSNSRMVLVRAEVGNTDGKLVPGQFLRVRIELPAEADVVAVPQTSVSSSLYGDSIYVLRPGETAEEQKAEQVFVTLGRRSDDKIEVIKGLKAGDVIVTSGQNRLTSGARVTPDNSVSLDKISAQ